MSQEPVCEPQIEQTKRPDTVFHRSNSSEVDLVAFHRLGDRSGMSTQSSNAILLRPALYADYGDLTTIRHDFPLVLLHQGADKMLSLSDAIDAALQQVATDNPAMVRQVLELEYRIKNLLSDGEKGTLTFLWKKASLSMLAELDDATRPSVEKNLSKVRTKIPFDGNLIDYQTDTITQAITHLWNQGQHDKTRKLKAQIDYLKQKLSDILQVDYLHSSDARTADRLESSLGTTDENVFDFLAMARILKSVPVGKPLPQKRKQRISDAISVFESQRFVSSDAYPFIFDNCGQALKTFNDRLPHIAALVKAMSIAELECENRYDESRHDAFYNRFDEDQLGPEDLSLFPSYLVCLDSESAHDVPDILRSGLPFKVVVLHHSVIGAPAAGQLSFGTAGQQLAHMAMGLSDIFVLQTAATALYQLRDSVQHGLAIDAPALLSIYVGNSDTGSRYLAAAAAAEARVFPSFVFNPTGGDGLALQFQLVGNPSSDQDWQIHQVHFEDAEQNKATEQVAFTLVDLVACDDRYSRHFVPIAKAQWTDDMLPIQAFLDCDLESRKGKLPYVLLINENDQLIRAICDVKMINATVRTLDLWHRLQELGGIKNSYVAQALLNLQQNTPQQALESKRETAEQAPTSESPATAKVPSTTAPAAVEAEELPDAIASDDPWIETIRCTSCNECTELNDRLFSYDDDLRAHIADPDGGTYKELVEAAENCQVAIIHPGKPRNPNEPGLAELIERAEPFLA